MENDFEQLNEQSKREFIDQQELKQITESDNHKIYPVLRNKDWTGIEHGALYMPLIGTFENPKIVIAVAYDMPNNLIFVPYKSGSHYEELNEIYDEAQKNLEELDVPYEVSEYNGHFEVSASGHEFSSELILHKPFIQELHTVLKSNEILVAIPRRGYFKAIASNTSINLYNTFIDEYEFIFNNHTIQKPQITNGVFVIENGKIKQRAELERY